MDRRHEDVLGLDVAVRDLVLVEVRERARELAQDRFGARFFDRLLLEDHVEQLPPRGLLHDESQTVPPGPYTHVAYDIWMPQSRQDAGLPQQPFRREVRS